MDFQLTYFFLSAQNHSINFVKKYLSSVSPWSESKPTFSCLDGQLSER